jgi:hypothetical protein
MAEAEGPELPRIHRSNRASTASDDPSALAGWSRPWRTAASLLILVHLVAILSAALAAAPSAPLVRALASTFGPYHQLLDQGYSYRYYAPEPPPTPVVEARLKFADKRPPLTLRIPDRQAAPRLRYQRQLSIANTIHQEWRAGDDPQARPRWTPAFARHLGRTYGARSVEFFVILHAIPPLGDVQRELDSGASTVDLDADRFYETPQWVGEYPCDGS